MSQLASDLNFEELLWEGLQEIGLYYLRFAVILFFWYLSRKMSPLLRWLLMAVSLSGTLFLTMRSGTASELFQTLLIGSTLTACLCLSGIISADFCEYGFVFSVLLLPPRLLNSSVTVFGPDVYFLIIMMLFLLAPFCTRDSDTEAGNEVSNTARYLGYIILAGDWFLLGIFTDLIYSGYLRRGGSHPFFYVIIPDILVCIIFLAGNILLCRKLSGEIRQLSNLGVRYHVVDRYSLLMMTGTTIAFFVLNLVLVYCNVWSSVFSRIMTVILLVVLLMQFLFLWMLLRVLHYRESVDILEQKEQQEKIYYDRLDQNLKAMAEVRHDIKNVFFTMGSYVNRSNDQEMKEYFWNRIYPFAGESIDRNYNFAQLAQIPSEHIRSFLYMKITEAVQRQIAVKVSVENRTEDFLVGMDILDLTRVLGILMDNAREECEKIPDSVMELRIHSRDQGVSYTIRNPISEDTLKNGFQKKGSTKPGHLGIGLKNVKKIIAAYENVSLNTYHDNCSYIQSLVIRPRARQKKASTAEKPQPRNDDR